MNTKEIIFFRYRRATDRFERACQRFHGMNERTSDSERAQIVKEYFTSREVYRELTSLLYELNLDDAYISWLDIERLKEVAVR